MRHRGCSRRGRSGRSRVERAAEPRAHTSSCRPAEDLRRRLHRLPHRKRPQRLMALPDEAGDEPPSPPRAGASHGVHARERRAGLGPRTVSTQVRRSTPWPLAKGVRGAGRRPGGWGLCLPSTTHGIPPGRAPMRTGTGRCGRPQAQRHPRACRSTTRRTDFARQLPRVVRSGEDWLLRSLTEGTPRLGILV